MLRPMPVKRPLRRSIAVCAARALQAPYTKARIRSYRTYSTDEPAGIRGDQGGSSYDPVYTVPLPAPGEPKRAVLDTYTKEHSAEYQSQALIDLAFWLCEKIDDFDEVKSIVIHTSHHTHYVIGTGAGI